NVHLDAVEHGDGIAFLHAVQEGAANKSYGLQVAALAGVPKEVVNNAKHKLRQLELGSQSKADIQQMPLQTSLPLEEQQTNQALSLLAEIDPDELTPKKALELIYLLKERA
ncbi:MAG TPA: DNA mismatch repair protein MutS, partial [Psychromonas sp.]